jgi:hydrogenase nickel incorporation protein HypA/HybF
LNKNGSMLPAAVCGGPIIRMHEMSIAQSLIQILQEEMAKHGAATLRSVRLSIGEMSAIVPESLSFCFEIITQGTPLEGAKLLMDRIPLKGYCPDCDQPFDIKDFVFICPTCRSPNIETIEGQELSIVEMEVE